MSLSLAEAHHLLERGQVVAVATDTVFGLAAKINAPDAISSIYKLKNRPESMALPLLLNGVEQAGALGLHFDARSLNLSLLWPGALTMIIPAPSNIAQLVHATENVAVRVPDDARLLELLTLCGPLAVTSANPHAEPAATSAEMVERYFSSSPSFGGVFGEVSGSSTASTIVDLTGEEWEIVREGGISRGVIEALLFQG